MQTLKQLTIAIAPELAGFVLLACVLFLAYIVL